jgi:hypothetical protein
MNTLDYFTVSYITSFTDVDTKLCMQTICSHWNKIIGDVYIKQYFTGSYDNEKCITIVQMFQKYNNNLIGYGSLNNSMRIIKYAMHMGECDYNLGLELACINKNIPIAQFMINCGANKPKNAFYKAYSIGACDIIKLLHESFNCEINKKKKFEAVCRSGIIENIVEVFDEVPVYKSYSYYGHEDENNREYINFMITGLFAAIRKENVDVIRLLLQKFDEDSNDSTVDLSSEDETLVGGDVFPIACSTGNLEVIKCVYEHVRRLNHQNFEQIVGQSIRSTCANCNLEDIKIIFETIEPQQEENWNDAIKGARQNDDPRVSDFITHKYYDMLGYFPKNKNENEMTLKKAIEYRDIEEIKKCLRRGEKYIPKYVIDVQCLQDICVEHYDKIFKLLIDSGMLDHVERTTCNEILGVMYMYCDRDTINYVQGKVGYLLRK